MKTLGSINPALYGIRPLGVDFAKLRTLGVCPLPESTLRSIGLAQRCFQRSGALVGVARAIEEWHTAERCLRMHREVTAQPPTPAPSLTLIINIHPASEPEKGE